MKKKNNIRAKGKGQKAVSRNPESHRGEVGSAKRGQAGAAPTERNSTVFYNKRSNRVIIDFSHEELAIRACDLLRFFNN